MAPDMEMKDEDCQLFSRIIGEIKRDQQEKELKAANQKEDLMRIIVNNKQKYKSLEQDYDKSLELARKRISDRDQKIESLQDKTKILKEQLLHYQNSLSRESDLNRDLSAKIDQQKNAIEDFEDRTDLITKLKSDLATFKATASSSENEQAQLLQDLQNKDKIIEKYKTDKTATASLLREEISDLTRKNKNLDKSYKTCSNDLSAANENFQRRVSACNTTIHNLKAKNRNNVARLTNEFNAQNATLSSKILKLRADSQNLRQQGTDLQNNQAMMSNTVWLLGILFLVSLLLNLVLGVTLCKRRRTARRSNRPLTHHQRSNPAKSPHNRNISSSIEKMTLTQQNSPYTEDTETRSSTETNKDISSDNSMI